MFSPFGIPGFDPSKMDPKTLMKLSQLVNSLPPQMLMKMQQLTHNMMAGINVQKDAEEFEKELPADFKAKLMEIIGEAQAQGATSAAPVTGMTTGAVQGTIEAEGGEIPQDVHEARLTVLRAVADGRVSPEDAEKLLFSEAG